MHLTENEKYLLLQIIRSCLKNMSSYGGIIDNDSGKEYFKVGESPIFIMDRDILQNIYEIDAKIKADIPDLVEYLEMEVG